MARPKHNAPCPCGSGKKYRNCHLQADRQAREATAGSESGPAPPVPSAVGPRGPWVRVLAWGIALGGSALGAWIAAEQSREGGFALIVGSIVAAGMIRIFGDPPPPKDDAGDPTAIDFGRSQDR